MRWFPVLISWHIFCYGGEGGVRCKSGTKWSIGEWSGVYSWMAALHKRPWMEWKQLLGEDASSWEVAEHLYRQFRCGRRSIHILSASLSIWLSIHQSLNFPTCMSLSIYPYIFLIHFISLYPSISLSIFTYSFRPVDYYFLGYCKEYCHVCILLHCRVSFTCSFFSLPTCSWDRFSEEGEVLKLTKHLINAFLNGWPENI